MSEEKLPEKQKKLSDASQNSEEQHLLQEKTSKEVEPEIEENTSPKKNEEIQLNRKLYNNAKSCAFNYSII